MIRRPSDALRSGALFASLLALLTLLAAGPALAADETLTANLSGTQEVPPVTSTGSGTAYLFVGADARSISYTVSYTGLSGPVVGAQIAWGQAGQNGAVMFELPVRAGTLFGQLTAADVRPATKSWQEALAAVRSGAAYVNLKTAAHPGGEVRGQMASAASTPSATPAATPSATAARPSPSTSKSQPPTDTAPLVGRSQRPGSSGLLLVPILGMLIGALAVYVVRPTPRRTQNPTDRGT